MNVALYLLQSDGYEEVQTDIIIIIIIINEIYIAQVRKSQCN